MRCTARTTALFTATATTAAQSCFVLASTPTYTGIRSWGGAGADHGPHSHPKAVGSRTRFPLWSSRFGGDGERYSVEILRLTGPVLLGLPRQAGFVVPVTEESRVSIRVDREIRMQPFALAVRMFVCTDALLVEDKEELGFPFPARVGGDEANTILAGRNWREFFPESSGRFTCIAPEFIPTGQAVIAPSGTGVSVAKGRIMVPLLRVIFCIWISALMARCRLCLISLVTGRTRESWLVRSRWRGSRSRWGCLGERLPNHDGGVQVVLPDFLGQE